MSNNINYPFSVRHLSEEDGGGFLIEFPDLPGCMADGETIEDALAEAEDAVMSWIKTAKELGDPIPEPDTLSKYSGQWRQRVPISLHAALVRRAKFENVSLNTFAATLLASGLGKKQQAARSRDSWCVCVCACGAGVGGSGTIPARRPFPRLKQKAEEYHAQSAIVLP